jgi:uncharacterized membrane protein YesL
MSDKQTTASQQKTKSLDKVAEQSTMPAGEWPGAWGLYKYSKEAVKFNLSPYLVASVLIPIGVSILVDILGFPQALNNLISTVVSLVFAVAATIIILAAIRHKKVELEDAVRQSFSIVALKLLGLLILLGLITIGSILLFIIPFFFIVPRISLAPYYLIDKNLGIIDSISASWDTTKGQLGKIYGIIGVNLAMSLLMITIIGIPFAVYLLFMYSAASPILYLFLDKKTTTKA